MPDERTYVAGVAPTATTAEQLLRANLRDKRAQLVREGEYVLPGFACALADIVQE